jgi:hypothetical protein
MSSRYSALEWDKWKQAKYNGQQKAEPTAQKFAHNHTQQSKEVEPRPSEAMSDANTIVMLESRNQELQTEVNRLAAENAALKKQLLEKPIPTPHLLCAPWFRIWRMTRS